ncbi:hypothetical protein GCM10010182_07310 [Actinomadura cremea]|nr:hypothetical protein GCM10010182_07310 [Actinomadura cremea]
MWSTRPRRRMGWAHPPEYIDRNAITVGDYLDEWLDAHAVEIKPKTLADYRHLIERHIKPNIGGLRLQAVRPGQITKLYRDLVTTGGRRGAGLPHAPSPTCTRCFARRSGTP